MKTLTWRMEKRINKFRGWLPRKPMRFDNDTLPDLAENESFTAPFSRSRIHQWVERSTRQALMPSEEGLKHNRTAECSICKIIKLLRWPWKNSIDKNDSLLAHLNLGLHTDRFIIIVSSTTVSSSTTKTLSSTTPPEVASSTTSYSGSNMRRVKTRWVSFSMDVSKIIVIISLIACLEKVFLSFFFFFLFLFLSFFLSFFS